jgi:hypothetical protein
MPNQAEKNNDMLKRILEMLIEQRKDIQILKQNIAYLKRQLPEPEKISTGWLW